LPPGSSAEVRTRDFAGDEEVRALVRAFEEAKILPSQFGHCAHIAVALSYLDAEPFEQALVRMRRSLLHFSRHHGVNVYHETVTHFWMKLLEHLAATHYRDLPLWRRINLIVQRWTLADPIAAHYSRALIRSRAARETWVMPDRLPLPF
jgi:hypothetical protein